MREAIALSMLSVMGLVGWGFVATIAVFKGEWVYIIHRFGLVVSLYVAGLFAMFVMLFAIPLRGYRSLRVTGSKMKYTETQLREDGWIK
jgi:uncharacterized membrane protein